MVNRKLDKIIAQHFASNKTALLLTGARQTGKTFAVRKYAEAHRLNLIEINFLEDEGAALIFQGAHNAAEVLLRISALKLRQGFFLDGAYFFTIS